MPNTGPAALALAHHLNVFANRIKELEKLPGYNNTLTDSWGKTFPLSTLCAIILSTNKAIQPIINNKFDSEKLIQVINELFKKYENENITFLIDSFFDLRIDNAITYAARLACLELIQNIYDEDILIKYIEEIWWDFDWIGFKKSMDDDEIKENPLGNDIPENKSNDENTIFIQAQKQITKILQTTPGTALGMALLPFRPIIWLFLRPMILEKIQKHALELRESEYVQKYIGTLRLNPSHYDTSAFEPEEELEEENEEHHHSIQAQGEIEEDFNEKAEEIREVLLDFKEKRFDVYEDSQNLLEVVRNYEALIKIIEEFPENLIGLHVKKNIKNTSYNVMSWYFVEEGKKPSRPIDQNTSELGVLDGNCSKAILVAKSKKIREDLTAYLRDEIFSPLMDIDKTFSNKTLDMAYAIAMIKKLNLALELPDNLITTSFWQYMISLYGSPMAKEGWKEWILRQKLQLEQWAFLDFQNDNPLENFRDTGLQAYQWLNNAVTDLEKLLSDKDVTPDALEEAIYEVMLNIERQFAVYEPDITDKISWNLSKNDEFDDEEKPEQEFISATEEPYYYNFSHKKRTHRDEIDEIESFESSSQKVVSDDDDISETDSALEKHHEHIEEIVVPLIIEHFKQIHERIWPGLVNQAEQQIKLAQSKLRTIQAYTQAITTEEIFRNIQEIDTKITMLISDIDQLKNKRLLIQKDLAEFKEKQKIAENLNIKYSMLVKDLDQDKLSLADLCLRQSEWPLFYEGIRQNNDLKLKDWIVIAEAEGIGNEQASKISKLGHLDDLMKNHLSQEINLLSEKIQSKEAVLEAVKNEIKSFIEAHAPTENSLSSCINFLQTQEKNLLAEDISDLNKINDNNLTIQIMREELQVLKLSKTIAPPSSITSNSHPL